MKNDIFKAPKNIITYRRSIYRHHKLYQPYEHDESGDMNDKKIHMLR